MSILGKIESDMKQAMLAKDQQRLDALRMLKSAVKYAAIEKPGVAQSDADVMQVIQKQIKQRHESITQFSQNGRPELAAKEEKELAVLEAFLPKQIGDAELDAVIRQVVSETGASSKKDFGKTMKAVSDKLAGGADNRRISEALGKILK